MNKMTFTERNYAPVPFWLWNSDQNEAELTRQLHCFYEAGFQAVAIHARIGNKTEYMSARWLELVRHACNEAKKIGLKIWLYDEEDWPSGPVGGRLPAKGPEFRQKLLRFQRMSWEDARSNPDLYAAFPVSDPGILLENENAEKFPPQQEVLAFLKGFCEYNMPDYLKRSVCDEFMKMTHEKYAAELTGLMPEILNTVYTDDLHILLDESGTPTFSWTDEFDSEFEKEHHYSFRHKLSCLVEDLPDAGKVRIDYRKTLSRMFRENFVAPMNDWAMQHKLHFTGHISGDEGPLLLEIAKITDPFEFLIAEEIPGVDDYLLGRHDGRYLAEATNHLTFDRTLHKQKGFSLIHTCKKAVSVASQFKNGRCSSEILSGSNT